MLTVVIQGNITQWTLDFANRYKNFDFVQEVIVSTWKEDDVAPFADFFVIQSEKHQNPGSMNRNLQIKSSYEGLKLVETPWALKVRSDMFLPHLKEMFYFARRNITNDILAFVLSVNEPFPFHPRDHAFLGLSDKITNIFNIPYCNNTFPHHNNPYVIIRTESYIGYHSYYRMHKNHDDLYQLIRSYPDSFLKDNSDRKQDALKIYREEIRNKRVFVPFPRFEIEWPKYHPNGYPFDRQKEDWGELYWDDL